MCISYILHIYFYKKSKYPVHIYYKKEYNKFKNEKESNNPKNKWPVKYLINIDGCPFQSLYDKNEENNIDNEQVKTQYKKVIRGDEITNRFSIQLCRFLIAKEK